jgi:hypothetical protein
MSVSVEDGMYMTIDVEASVPQGCVLSSTFYREKECVFCVLFVWVWGGHKLLVYILVYLFAVDMCMCDTARKVLCS